MKKVLFTVLFIAFLGITFGGNEGDSPGTTSNTPVQSVVLTGKVVDLNSGESLTGVEVSIEGSDYKAYTDFDGNYKFENVKPGKYNLIASYISYKKSLVENFQATRKHNVVNIKLEETN